MSGQGGIAVAISVIQTYLAIVTTLANKKHAPSDGPASSSQGSVVAGMGLWAAGVVALGLCFLARQRIMKHHKSVTADDDLADAAAQYEAVGQDSEEGDGREPPAKRPPAAGDNGRLRAVFRKNALLEFSVAWVFVVTLVSATKRRCRHALKRTACRRSILPSRSQSSR